MAWTESRSRDEWLAEVRRRGERLKRRRRMTFALVGALALVMPMSALAGFVTADGDGGARQLVAGPAPAAQSVPTFGVDDRGQPLVAGEPPATTTTVDPPQEPVAAGSGSTPSSIPPAHDPVVRPTPTTAPSRNSSDSAQSTQQPATLGASAPAQPPPPCTAADFSPSVTVDKSTYRPGEMVRGSFALEKRSAGTCLGPPSGVDFKTLDSSGTDVFPTGVGERGNSSTRPPMPAGGVTEDTAGPGTFVTGSFYWTPCRDPWPLVSKEECVPFPAGTYTVVATWTGPENGPPTRTTFQLTA